MNDALLRRGYASGADAVDVYARRHAASRARGQVPRHLRHAVAYRYVEGPYPAAAQVVDDELGSSDFSGRKHEAERRRGRSRVGRVLRQPQGRRRGRSRAAFQLNNVPKNLSGTPPSRGRTSPYP